MPNKSYLTLTNSTHGFWCKTMSLFFSRGATMKTYCKLGIQFQGALVLPVCEVAPPHKRATKFEVFPNILNIWKGLKCLPNLYELGFPTSFQGVSSVLYYLLKISFSLWGHIATHIIFARSGLHVFFRQFMGRNNRWISNPRAAAIINPAPARNSYIHQTYSLRSLRFLKVTYAAKGSCFNFIFPAIIPQKFYSRSPCLTFCKY